MKIDLQCWNCAEEFHAPPETACGVCPYCHVAYVVGMKFFSTIPIVCVDDKEDVD